MAMKRRYQSETAWLAICALLAFSTVQELVAETTLPNEFKSGSPAKASEVNENFAALDQRIDDIAMPEKSYSILSSETLSGGLVRIKLYAYGEADYTAKYYDRDGAFVVDGVENIVNALGRFRVNWTYSVAASNYSETEKEERGITRVTEVLPGACPDGSGIDRVQTDELLYVLSISNSLGGFVMSNEGSTQATDATTTPTSTGLSKAGVYYGCDEKVEYYYLEGTGVGKYSCIDRVAYYGAFSGDSGAWSKAWAPRSKKRPSIVTGVFDSTTNGQWGTYYLEIDAPADCLNL